MQNDNVLENLSTASKSRIQYSISLAPQLHKKLDQHLQVLKYIHHPENKRQTWILNAINEKISRDKESKVISKEKYLSVKLDKNTAKELDSRLAEICKLHPGFSKKQWILEAIEEKLELEKEAVQTRLKEHCLDQKR